MHAIPRRKVETVYCLRIQSGEQALSGWAANRHCSVSVAEAHAPLAEAVDMGGLDLRMILRVQDPIVKVITDNEEDVH